jgi:predicted phage terminase large subunit-like protein
MKMETVNIRPQPKQEAFLTSSADIAIFGGGAGGGKTFALLLEPLYHVGNPDFGAVIFRRTMPEITKEKGMLDESMSLYPLLGAVYNKNENRWTFPSGARVSFSHLQYETDLAAWRGAQIALLEFDQLETFTEQQFWYMLSRNRSTCGVKPYVRATCNPEPGWLADLLAWWIGEDGYPIPERAGRLRWFVRNGERLIWADDSKSLRTEYPDLQPKSLTFIPANVFDNQILMQKDPGYLANLKSLAPLDRERLLAGNWKIKPSAGKVFNRTWFSIVPAAPAGGQTCIYWDFAATEKSMSKPDPDYTAAVVMRKAGGRWYVLDCIAAQVGPAEVERMFVNLTRQWAERARADGSTFLARWEQEPGSASKREASRMAGLLAGIDAHAVPSQGDKISRAKAMSAQAEAGNISLVAAPWNTEWLEHMHGQPDLPHDDIMDASAGAFNALVGAGQVAYAPSIWD